MIEELYRLITIYIEDKTILEITKIEYKIKRVYLREYYKSHINRGKRVIQKKEELIGCNAKRLMFNNIFNEDISLIKDDVTHLTFGLHFNQSVDKLPQSIT